MSQIDKQPSDQAIQKALNHLDYDGIIAVPEIRTGAVAHYRTILGFARYIEEHEQPLAEVKIPNPSQWFWARDKEAEWWNRGGASRDACIEAVSASAEDEGGFWIAQACRLEPDFKIFDAEELCEQLGDQEVWDEGGADGVPLFTRKCSEAIELETELATVFKRWYIKHGGDLTGAQLDFITEPEFISSTPAAPAEGGQA